MDHRIIHFEIPADDPSQLVSFYTQLLGWKIEKMPNSHVEYWGCHTGEGMGINGAIMKRMHPQQPVTNYVNVEQMETMLEKAKELGAKIIVPKSAVPQMGYFAIALDPQNNTLGFWQNDKSAS